MNIKYSVAEIQRLDSLYMAWLRDKTDKAWTEYCEALGNYRTLANEPSYRLQSPLYHQAQLSLMEGAVE